MLFYKSGIVNESPHPILPQRSIPSLSLLQYLSATYLLLSNYIHRIHVRCCGWLYLVRRSLLPPLHPRRVIDLHLLHEVTVVIVIEFVQRLQHDIAAHDVLVEEPRQRLGDLVVHVSACGHSEDVVQLLERALLRLRNPEEDHHKRDDIKTSIEAECALWMIG